jgi:diaminopimelate epimerase
MNKKFHKMHGCGNNFVIMDYENFDKDKIQLICDRKYGIGCDQLILLQYNQDSNSNEYDCEMIIFNSDGSSAAFCGNGLRCVGKLLFSFEKFQRKKELKIKSREKISIIWRDNNLISTNIRDAKLIQELEIEKYYDLLSKGFLIDVGNLHAVFFVHNFNFDYKKIGEEISNLDIFPQQINVNFAQILSNQEILLQTYEAGSGITIACGSGSCATFFAAYKNKLISDNHVKISFLQGKKDDFLNISLNEKEEILMTGSATYVFEGNLTI